jgi:hypothetical protein
MPEDSFRGQQTLTITKVEGKLQPVEGSGSVGAKVWSDGLPPDDFAEGQDPEVPAWDNEARMRAGWKKVENKKEVLIVPEEPTPRG